MSDFDIATAINNVENHSNSLYPRSERLSFFDTVLGQPDWENSKILDIGGNRGNPLEDPQQKNRQRRKLLSLDVDQVH